MVKFIVNMVALSLLLLAGCQNAQPTPLPSNTPEPTLTPTPDVFTLEPVPTAIPAGEEGNPLVLVMAGAYGSEDNPEAVDDLADALADALDPAAFTLREADGYAEAVSALCENPAAAAWLDAFAYFAAEARGCAVAVMQVADGAITARGGGVQADLVLNTRVNVNSLAALRGETFCRLGPDDAATWLLPVMMMRADGLNPLSELAEIVDYADLDALIEAVYSGQGSAAGIPAGALEETDLADTYEDLADVVVVFGTSRQIPFDVLAVSARMPESARLSLVAALLEVAASSAGGRLLESVIGSAEIAGAGPEDLRLFRDFLKNAGLDLAMMGQVW